MRTTHAPRPPISAARLEIGAALAAIALAAVLPAMRAARLNVIKALPYE